MKDSDNENWQKLKVDKIGKKILGIHQSLKQLVCKIEF